MKTEYLPVSIEGMPYGWTAKYVVDRGYDSPDRGYEAWDISRTKFATGYSKDNLLEEIFKEIEETKPVSILLDADGPIADFLGSVFNLFNIDRLETIKKWSSMDPRPWDVFEVLPETSKKYWTKINAVGQYFWEHINPTPWAFDLVELCGTLAPTSILTLAQNDPSSYSGKAAWISKNFPGIPHMIARGRTDTHGVKSICAHSRALLIDDSYKNCSEFTDRGGQAILFPSLGNELHHLSEDPMAHIRNQLSGYFGVIK